MTNPASQRRDPRRIWISLPAILLISLDALTTLFFQPPEFWDVSFQFGIENNPISRALMHLHPAGFIAFILIWIGCVLFLVGRLPAPWHRALGLAVVVGHAWGFSSWLYHRSSLTYWPRIVFFLAVGVMTILMWERASPPAKPSFPD